MRLAICLNLGVTPRQHLLNCLIALRDQHTLDVVAEKADCSAEYLSQFINGVKLQKSQKERGLGPGILQKLEGAYPGWSDIPDFSTAARDEIEAAVIAELRLLRPESPFRKAAAASLRSIVQPAPLGELRTQPPQHNQPTQRAA